MSRWIVWLVGLLAINTAVFALVPVYRYRTIVIHHTAGAAGDYESIRRQHRARGWGDAAYHLILSNGSAGIPAGRLEATGRHRRSGRSVATKSAWCNLAGIHLCVVGDYRSDPLPAELRPALGHAIRVLQRRYRIDDEGIRLHSDCSRTACPGDGLSRSEVLAMLDDSAACPTDVRAQHEDVISGTELAPWSLSRPVLQAMSVGSVAFTLIVMRWPSSRRRRPRSRRRSRG